MVLSIAAIGGVMAIPGYRVPTAVLVLASSSAGASAMATLWVLMKSRSWAKYRSTRPTEFTTVSSHLRALICRLQPTYQWIVTLRSAQFHWRKWIVGIVFFGPILVGIIIIGVTAHEPALNPKPLQDLLVAFGVLLVGLPLSIGMRNAPNAVAWGTGIFALIIFIFPVLSDVVVCGMIAPHWRWFCAAFDDFQKWRSGYTGIGFMFLGIALPSLVAAALDRVNLQVNMADDTNATHQSEVTPP